MFNPASLYIFSAVQLYNLSYNGNDWNDTDKKWQKGTQRNKQKTLKIANKNQ